MTDPEEIITAKWASQCPSNHTLLAAAYTTCTGQPWTKVRGVKHEQGQALTNHWLLTLATTLKVFKTVTFNFKALVLTLQEAF